MNSYTFCLEGGECSEGGEEERDELAAGTVKYRRKEFQLDFTPNSFPL